MWIYFLFFFLILFAAFHPQLERKGRYCTFLYVSLTIFLCLGYMCGTDWRQFEMLYYGQMKAEHEEIGYVFINNLFSSLHVDFWIFNIALKLFCFITMIKFIRRYSHGYAGWGMLFFYVYIALSGFIDCPLRNIIAASVFLYALEGLYHDKTGKFVVLTIIAALFHTSVLVIAPLVFLIWRRKALFKWKTVFIGVLVFYGIAIALWETEVLTIVNLYLAYIGDFKNVNYFLQVGSVISPAIVLYILLYWFILKNGHTNMDKYDIYNSNLSVLFILCFMGFYFVPMFHRFIFYVFAPFAISLNNAIKHENKKYIKIPAVSAMVIFLSFSMFNTITKDYRYVPYSNYLQYIFREKPNFNYRSNYNFANSPYKDKDNEFELRQ